MKTIPIGVVGTLVWGVVAILKDGRVLAWTEGDENAVISLDGTTDNTYELLSNPGFTVENLVSTAGLAVDNTEIYVIAGSDLSVTDILSRKVDGARVFFFRYGRKNPAAGIVAMSRGSFGNFKPRIGQFIVEYRDLRQALQMNSTWLLQEGCRWRHGDDRCGRDLTPETFTFTVTAVASQYEFTAAALVQADDYFGNSPLTFDTGLNAGAPPFKVKEFAAGVVTLSEAPIFEIQIGDTGTVPRGCRKRAEDCKDRDNIRRYGGEKDKPSRDDLIAPAVPEEV